MPINEHNGRVYELKLNLDGTLIANHVFKPSRNVICLNLVSQWTEPSIDEHNQVGCLETHRGKHDEIRAQALLYHPVHELFRRLDH